MATFVFRHNERVEEALRRLDRTERLEEEVAALAATNANLLDRLLPAEVRVLLFSDVAVVGGGDVVVVVLSR